jgi:hypothetical protein
MPKDETKQSLLNHHAKKPPPPAYSAYFDDPTLYAQIDHCNYNNNKSSTTSTLLGSSGQSLNNGSLKTGTVGIVGITSGGGLLMTEQQHSQYNQLISPLTSSSSAALCNQTNQMLGGSNNMGTLPFTSTTPTYTSISTSGVASPYQSSNYQTLPLTTSSNKQFLRDLVTTTKTPLSFSEQESCV